MKTIRKLLIGGLTFLVVVACIVGTACLVKRQVYVAICDAFPVAFEGPVGAMVDIDRAAPDRDGESEQSGSAFIASQAGDDDDEMELLQSPFDRGLRGPVQRGPVQHDRAQLDRAQLDRVQAAIEEGLGDASPEEREIWLSELKNESPEDIRQILSLHRRMSPPATLQAGSRSPDSDGVEMISAEATPPRLLQPAGIVSSPRGTDDALRLLESSIKAVESVEQVILNNIANAHTIGFKRSRALFGDESYRHVALPGQIDTQGRPTTSGIALGAGARILANQIDVSQGRLRQTQQPLDLAIQGEGYFQINDGTRILYTRMGAFGVNADGEIVLMSKDRAQTLEPKFTIPQDAIRIMASPDGIISVQESGEAQLTHIGQIQLAQFMNPQGLTARGENLFEQTTASGTPNINTPGRNGVGEIRQGALEESNVVVADELAELRRMQEQLKTLQQLQFELGGSATAR